MHTTVTASSEHLGPTDQIRMKFNLLSPRQWRLVADRFTLTRRERQVCELLFECKTRREIAEALGISDRTVRGFMEQIHSKLAVKNRVGVVLRIIESRDAIAVSREKKQ